MSSWCPSSPAPTGPAPSRVVSVNHPAQQPPGTQPSPEIPRDCRVSGSGVLRTIRGPRLSSLGSCGWSGVTALFTGCVLPKFPVIIIIWKFHETSLFSFQQEFRSTHQNTNVYDPGNGLPLEATRSLLSPCWTSQLITLFLNKITELYIPSSFLTFWKAHYVISGHMRIFFGEWRTYIYLRPSLASTINIEHIYIFGHHWLPLIIWKSSFENGDYTFIFGPHWL